MAVGGCRRGFPRLACVMESGRISVPFTISAVQLPADTTIVAHLGPGVPSRCASLLLLPLPYPIRRSIFYQHVTGFSSQLLFTTCCETELRTARRRNGVSRTDGCDSAQHTFGERTTQERAPRRPQPQHTECLLLSCTVHYSRPPHGSTLQPLSHDPSHPSSHQSALHPQIIYAMLQAAAAARCPTSV